MDSCGTQSDAYFGEFYGTSSACPHVAGVVGLLADIRKLSNADIRDALFSTARDIDDGSVGAPVNRKIGYGYLDAEAARNELDIPISVSATGDTTAGGGTVDLSISAVDIDQIIVDGLWTDWTVDSAQSDGSTFTNNTSSHGRSNYSWERAQISVSPSPTVNLPARYIGGIYEVTVTGTGQTGQSVQRQQSRFPDFIEPGLYISGAIESGERCKQLNVRRQVRGPQFVRIRLAPQ
ncbi:S8 family serine peptidase [Halosimplex rubrum]|uniref:S8 family serine peptidase n=1 Tax=Halosimplex rubrum TaxID=869889 RepID=A0A7D5NZ54_9EURY|nr:S8 family serine peptidase [Halosimplex rubrum]QLH76926.1 S8 family serine peptidase [Halosimplex rubrum]